MHLPIQKWEDVFYLGAHNVRPHADSVIRASSKAAALEGMGLGLGGLITVVPDLGFLSTITLRLLQKLSLLYGFEYTSEEEAVELWIAAASAAGLELGRDILENRESRGSCRSSWTASLYELAKRSRKSGLRG